MGNGHRPYRYVKIWYADLRAFFDADIRWIDHYGFRPLDVPTLFGGLSNS